jgi:hypothetical protein
VRTMDTIEVADGHDGASKAARNVIEFVEELHFKSLTAEFAKVSQSTQRTSLRASGKLCDLCGQKLFPRSSIYFLC